MNVKKSSERASGQSSCILRDTLLILIIFRATSDADGVIQLSLSLSGGRTTTFLQVTSELPLLGKRGKEERERRKGVKKVARSDSAPSCKVALYVEEEGRRRETKGMGSNAVSLPSSSPPILLSLSVFFISKLRETLEATKERRRLPSGPRIAA